MPAEEFYTVSQIVVGVAVLENDRNQRISVPTTRLKPRLKKGMVLRVRLDATGAPAWYTAEIDRAEGARRTRELESEVEELREQGD